MVFRSIINKTTLLACSTIPHHCYTTFFNMIRHSIQNLQHTPSLGRHGAAASFAVHAATTVPWWRSLNSLGSPIFLVVLRHSNLIMFQEKNQRWKSGFKKNVVYPIPDAICWIIWGCFQFETNLFLQFAWFWQGTGCSFWRNEDGRKKFLLPPSIATPDVRTHSTGVDAVEGYLLSKLEEKIRNLLQLRV